MYIFNENVTFLRMWHFRWMCFRRPSTFLLLGKKFFCDKKNRRWRHKKIAAIWLSENSRNFCSEQQFRELFPAKKKLPKKLWTQVFLTEKLPNRQIVSGNLTTLGFETWRLKNCHDNKWRAFKSRTVASHADSIFLLLPVHLVHWSSSPRALART